MTSPEVNKLTRDQEVRVHTLSRTVPGTVTRVGRVYATILYNGRRREFDMQTRRQRDGQVGTGIYYEVPDAGPSADAEGEQEYAWTVEGESHHPHSSQEWQPEEASGTIKAEGAGEALERIVRGVGSPLNDTIPWDIIDQDREITITIRPADTESEG